MRHIAVFHDAGGNLDVRWTRRKNRPKGSIFSKAMHMSGRHDYLLAMQAWEVHAAQEERLASVQHELL